MPHKPWPPEDDEQLRKMYATDTSARVIGQRLGRSVAAVRARAYYLGISDADRSRELSRGRMIDQNQEQGAYRRGRKARQEGFAKRPPGGLTAIGRGWWLAGWHDRDMELGNRFIEGNAS